MIKGLSYLNRKNEAIFAPKITFLKIGRITTHVYPLNKKVIFPFWVIILILTDYILRFQVNEDSLYYFFEKIDPLPSTMVKYCDIKSFFSILVFSES